MLGNACARAPVWLRPVELGQTRCAFYLSAILIALWLLARPTVSEAAYITGSSEDQYLRAEWMYNLEEGYGFLSLKDKIGTPGDPTAVGLRGLRFQTRGVPFTTVGGEIGRTVPSPRVWVYPPGSLPVYGYSSMTSPHSAICLPSVALFTFPKQGIALYQTTLDYSISAVVSAGLISNVLSFVSIQTIPEPATAVTAIGAAALAVGAGWRLGRRDEESTEEPGR